MDTAIVPFSPDTPVTPIAPSENNEPPTAEAQSNKRRRKKSIVWDHFTVETVGEGCIRALCKQCKKSFAYITGSKLAGTSHLKRHIALGICPVNRQQNQQMQGSKTASTADQPRKRPRTTGGYAGIPFEQDRCNREIVKMVIMHEYPLHIVEHPGFIDFVRTLQPQFNMVSFNSIQGDCVATYLWEKQQLLNSLNGIPGRVSLALDLWTSQQTIGYVFLTGHFIDSEWKLQRRILNVIMVPYPDSDFAFNQAVVSCLSDWHLENGPFTLTLDQSFSNETIYENLRGLLSVNNPYMLNGQLLIGNCYARIISHLAQDLLGAMGETVKKIRETVKHVKTSDVNEDKFLELKQQLQVPSTKDLSIDDQKKWNTTYLMLVAASELREVFLCLETADPYYKIVPSTDDWKQVDILCSYLKLFFDAANLLTAPTYPTANLFFHEVSKIQLDLTHAAMNPDPFISSMIKPLKEKFDKYWSDCWLILAIAVVMDPRFKMKLIEFSFSRIYGEDAGTWIKIVDDGIHELFSEYLVQTLQHHEAFQEEGNGGIVPKAEPPEEVSLHEGDSQGYSQEGSLQGHPQERSIQGHAQGPFQEGHPQEGSLEEGYPQEVSLQGHPQEESFEGHPQEESFEGHPKKDESLQGNHQEGSLQGNHQEEPLQGNHQDEPLQGHHQEESLQGHHQEESLQGHHQEGHPQQDSLQEHPHDSVHTQEVHSQDPLISIGDGLSDFEVYISEIGGSQQMKLELDQYLEESLLPREHDFDILGWWKLNKLKYPTLSRMASDILSIPFSTVPVDSVFDTQQKQMDSYRSSLRPVTLEALICAKDWLQYGSSSSELQDTPLKIEF